MATWAQSVSLWLPYDMVYYMNTADRTINKTKIVKVFFVGLAEFITTFPQEIITFFHPLEAKDIYGFKLFFALRIIHRDTLR